MPPVGGAQQPKWWYEYFSSRGTNEREIEFELASFGEDGVCTGKVRGDPNPSVGAILHITSTGDQNTIRNANSCSG